MKRRWWIVLGSAGFASIGLIVGLWAFFEDPINQQNCERIKSGMTEAEVENILGPPSKTTDLSDFSVHVVMLSDDGEAVMRRQKSEQTWKGRSGSISVCIVEGGIVAYTPRFEQTEVTFLQKIRQWVGLDPPVMGDGYIITPNYSSTGIIPD